MGRVPSPSPPRDPYLGDPHSSYLSITVPSCLPALYNTLCVYPLFPPSIVHYLRACHLIFVGCFCTLHVVLTHHAIAVFYVVHSTCRSLSDLSIFPGPSDHTMQKLPSPPLWASALFLLRIHFVPNWDVGSLYHGTQSLVE